MEATLAKFIFIYLAVALVFTSTLVISSRNAVHAVLWMLVMFFHQAVLFLTAGAEFLAAVQIIVYAGAVLVLFLFVIYLINLRLELKIRNFVFYWPAALFMAASLGVLAVGAVKGFVPGPKSGILTSQSLVEIGHTKLLGRLLFSEYVLAFEAAGVILLVAVLGAVILTKRLQEGAKR
ncbi:NADH-quinone oxidoreductase subunit J family protein [Thermosulfuriphilus sp.]